EDHVAMTGDLLPWNGGGGVPDVGLQLGEQGDTNDAAGIVRNHHGVARLTDGKGRDPVQNVLGAALPQPGAGTEARINAESSADRRRAAIRRTAEPLCADEAPVVDELQLRCEMNLKIAPDNGPHQRKLTGARRVPEEPLSRGSGDVYIAIG